ncbi:MAG: hypothetical protein VKJ04_11440 [Vampirovibrionales bacterium]|nr:hypothetical protein [Vampirovibrionales bacterium]
MNTASGTTLSTSHLASSQRLPNLMQKASYPFFGSSAQDEQTGLPVGGMFMPPPIPVPSSFITPPSADRFEKSALTAPGASPADLAHFLKQQHQQLSGTERKQFFNDLSASAHQAKSHEASQNGNPYAYRMDENSNASQLVQKLQELDATQRVDFVRQLTGDNSAYTRYTEKVLLYQQPPSQKETNDLFMPQPQHWNPSGIQEAFSSMALGLLTLPIVIPSLAISSPTSLAAVATKVGLWLI